MTMLTRRLIALTAALLLSAPALAHTSVDLNEARNGVKGAEQDVADAGAYLADLEKGDFAGIYGIGAGGAIRCGEAEANPACTPLSDADMAQALAEAQELVANAKAELADAQVRLAAAGGSAAPVQTASAE